MMGKQIDEASNEDESVMRETNLGSNKRKTQKSTRYNNDYTPMGEQDEDFILEPRQSMKTKKSHDRSRANNKPSKDVNKSIKSSSKSRKKGKQPDESMLSKKSKNSRKLIPI